MIATQRLLHGDQRVRAWPLAAIRLPGTMARFTRWAGRWLAGVAASAVLAATALGAEPPTEPMLRIEAGMHSALIYRIDTDAAGRFAVTASADKTARVWDVASGQLLQVLRPPIGPGHEGKLYSVALSPDGGTVATAGWTGYDWVKQHHVYLFDRASGRLLRRLTGLPDAVQHLTFSTDGRWLAATLGLRNGVRVWDWRRSLGPWTDTDYGDSSYGASWSRDGKLVTSALDGQLRLYETPTGSTPGALTRVAQVSAPGSKQPFAVAFSPDGTQVAVGYFDSPRVDVLDGTRLQTQFSADTQGVSNIALGRVAWSADGHTLAAAGRWGVNGKRPVRKWPNAGRGQPRDVPTTLNTVLHLAALPQGGWLLSAADPSWGVLAADGRWQPHGTAPTADLRESRGSDAFLLAAGGRQLQFGYEERGRAPHVFDLSGRTLVAGRLAGGQAPDIKSVQVQDWVNTPSPRLNGKALALQTIEISRSLAATAGGTSFVLGTEWWLRHFNSDGSQRWQQPAPGTTWGVNIPQDGPLSGQLVVAAYGDGTIRWHRLSDGQELLALFPHADRKRWVLWTPSGYYDASPGAEDLIGWHINRGQDQAADFYPASRFRDRFWRPDIIERVLDTLDEARAIAQANDARGQRQPIAPVSIAQVLPPVVDVLSGTDIQALTSQVTLRVRGRSLADAPVTSWRLRVNGQAVDDARGLGRQEATPGEREMIVAVPTTDSEIQVFAENRFGVSAPAVVRVKWAGAASAAPPQPGGFAIQPKLYVLAVGVGAYQNAAISKLTFPAKDARDFAAAMARQKGSLYREVEVKLLTEAEATADAVVDGLDWLKRQVTQHDVAAVFIAGHGVNDTDLGGYAYLPANADPARLRRTSVPMDEFKRTLSRLPGKALFFFDTCHSGNVLGASSGLAARGGPNDVSGVINELASAENGVVVFSSSTGRQLSYENSAWANGAFTKAVVEGLDGAADYQKSGRITHKMLDLYISERVKVLTKGLQSPVTQAPGGVPDFPVAFRR